VVGVIDASDVLIRPAELSYQLPDMFFNITVYRTNRMTSLDSSQWLRQMQQLTSNFTLLKLGSCTDCMAVGYGFHAFKSNHAREFTF